MAQKICPKCGSTKISFQREQSGNIGAGTNTVVIKEARKSRGCLYWLCIGWWKNLLFGGKSRGGINIHANKTLNKTVAVCQKCGHSWKVK